MNLENLISLADRTEEERKRIARLGGLARQEQRRKTFKLRKTLNNMLELEDIIGQYSNLRNKKTYNYKNPLKWSASYYELYLQDAKITYNKLLEEEEAERLEKEKKRKQQRKEINSRYYRKHKETLRKP